MFSICIYILKLFLYMQFTIAVSIWKLYFGNINFFSLYLDFR